jgi:hypothetical protein
LTGDPVAGGGKNQKKRLERPLRDCARPPFALEHLQQRDAGHRAYHYPKPRPDGPRDLVLTPRELIDRIAAPVPRPRRITFGRSGQV